VQSLHGFKNPAVEGTGKGKRGLKYYFINPEVILPVRAFLFIIELK